MNFKQKVLSIMGPLTLFLYLTISLVCLKFGVCDKSIWWKMLPIFLLNLIIPVIIGAKKIKFSVPLVITIIYLTLGFVSSYLGQPLWHPGWTIFLLIPVFEVIIKPNKKEEPKNKHYDYESEE